MLLLNFNPMKSLLKISILSVIVILIWSCERNDSIKLNDDNFLQSLLKQGIDIDGNAKISPDEAASVVSLHLDNDTISDLTGIEAFINLDTLICNNNELTSLDVSKLVGLVYLNCEDNEISFLNLSSNVLLERLLCSHNNLTSLDFSSNPELYRVYCEYNNLTGINVSNNFKLEQLICRYNQLSALDVTNNTQLKALVCGDNELITLDLSKNIKLTHLDIPNMPSLNKVCIWELPFPPIPLTFYFMVGSPNVYFSTDCN